MAPLSPARKSTFTADLSCVWERLLPGWNPSSSQEIKTVQQWEREVGDTHCEETVSR